MRSRLRRWVFLSAAAHLVLLLLVLPALQPEPELEIHEITEVDLVDQQPESPRPSAQARPARAAKPADPQRRPSQRKKRRAAQRSSPRPQQPIPPAPATPAPEPSPLLTMRQPEPLAAEQAEPQPAAPDRTASFWSGHPRPAPPPSTSHQRLGSVEETRYADGGRVLRSDDGPPDPAALGLLDLAAERLGQRTGSQACNPYRDWHGTNDRELILMVDTSGSMVRNRRAPASLVCAAGAAVAALDRGIPVTVINFSSITQRYGPTRDLQVVYRALSTFQAEGTMLPAAGLLALSGSSPRDLVLISDTGIHNLKEVLPDYGKALRNSASNRALLYYLGGGAVEGLDPLEALQLIQRAGFQAEAVDRS